MSRIDALLHAMTLEEKLGQLNLVTAGQAVTGPVVCGDTTKDIAAGRVAGVFNLWDLEALMRAQRCAVQESRLGVPLLFGLDVLHGFRTIFSIPLAEAGAFDPQLWERTACAAALEAASEGIHLTFAPMLDVSRDPRWGRIAEGPGEDPLVGERFAQAKIRGFQGDDFSRIFPLAATAKHFCAGGAATAGRDYAAVDVSERALHEVYLPPFRAAVEAGCAAVMTAFNNVNGVPMSAQGRLLNGYLRSRLKFDGVIMSDYTAIAELVEHGVAADSIEAAAIALKAGVDMDMVSGVYLAHLPEALARGLVEERDIDVAVARVLQLKERLGLFDDPYRVARLDDSVKETHCILALEAARRSATLLINRGLLPLSANLRRIAVVGPLADAGADMLGPWSAAGGAENCVTILEGLRRALPYCEIAHHSGVAIEGDDESGIAPAFALAEGADAVVLCLGEAARMSGEAACRASLGLPGKQRQLAERVMSAGAPTVALLSCGRPLAVPWLFKRAQAVVAAWFLGHRAGEAIADILTGRFNPSARLAVTWPCDVGQVPIFYSARSTGRPFDAANFYTSRYLDCSNDPQFPFGHGLSFSRTTLSNLRVDCAELKTSQTTRVRVDVCNESDIATEETIFLFARDRVASVARPLMELKDWKKIALQPQQGATIDFVLCAQAFQFPGENMEPTVEPGGVDIFVGFSADAEKLLSARLRIVSA
ncbi:glycoside hydrolase family 3 N-terminal domain-containing protein [Methylocystis sp. SC2]|uniref:glycoside hydrolase family 3 N-terminal domain-containing protein n=1 Tax=Methylocystis sp. (strain SC2) TaxID=187303 RepID=UPI00027AE873|nr:glycoside hydrolase family 3 N-terminal domain-containing protein [Methylocystis sp. SC2]CCJ07333.1 Glycoside hydrolase family 3 domain protein [Methylocystis sp. SC2]